MVDIVHQRSCQGVERKELVEKLRLFNIQGRASELNEEEVASLIH